jgi:hypothetical protein
MMNGIGKFLVLCQTVLSVLFMTWAAMVYFQYTDYGWKEPLKIWETKDSGYRVAGLLDKRTAILYEMYRQKERALPAIKPALETLNASMRSFPKNHQFYVSELEKLQSSQEAIAPKQLTWKDGQIVLEAPVIGKPAMKAAVAGVEKSTKSTKSELEKILQDIEAIIPEIAKLVQEKDAITIQLNGTKDDNKNTVDIGLYEILENESTLQNKIRDEKEYITPKYVEAQGRVERFRERLASMKRTLAPVK